MLNNTKADNIMNHNIVFHRNVLVFLQKISCTRQSKSKFLLRSFALSLHKITTIKRYNEE